MLATAATALAPNAAVAATVEVVDSYQEQVVHAIPPEPLAIVTFKGGPEADVVTVAHAGKAVVLTDSVGLVPGKGCTAAGDGSVTCAASNPESSVAVEIDTGEGDDSVHSSTGATLAGGPGNDRLMLDHGGMLIGGPGDDVLTGGGMATASYADHRTGVKVDLGKLGRPQGAPGERDILSGIDSVIGGAGDDVLSRGTYLSGGAGDDVLTAAKADTELTGGKGDDRLIGGPGNDSLEGWGGSDRLDGHAGDDSLEAESSSNTDEFAASEMFDRSRDRNVLRGGPGNDSLRPGYGSDRLDGGRGRDAFGGEESELSRRDTAIARDDVREVVRCEGGSRGVVADRLDLTLGCGARIRRTGAARPAFADAPLFDYDPTLSRFAALDPRLGCSSDMPRRCRFQIAVRQRGRAVTRATWTARPGRETRRELRLVSGAVRDAQCVGRFDLAITVRTRDARERAVTLRRRYRETVDRHPEKC